MPTKKQLYRNWESQIGLFGGAGQPQQSFESFGEGHGFTAERLNDKPSLLRTSSLTCSGEIIGKIRINGETKEVEIIPNQDKGESSQ